MQHPEQYLNLHSSVFALNYSDFTWSHPYSLACPSTPSPNRSLGCPYPMMFCTSLATFSSYAVTSAEKHCVLFSGLPFLCDSGCVMTRFTLL